MNKLDVNSDMYRIIGCAMKVRHNLGNGFSESVYEKAFQMELEEAGFSARLQVRIPVFYKGVNLHRDYVADVLVNDSIIVELKAVRCLAKVHEEQIGHYLRAHQSSPYFSDNSQSVLHVLYSEPRLLLILQSLFRQ